MIKSIFYKMLENPENRAKLDSLKDWKDENREFEVYRLFQENGYGKDFESFRIELRAFLNSDEIVKIFESDGNELPEEVLESVAGGFGVKHAVITGLTSLILACTGAITLSPIISDLGKDNDVSVSSEVKDDNGDSGSKFDDWDRNSDEKDKDEIKGFEKGPKGERAKDLNRSDRKKSDRKDRGWILREAQKKRGSRGGGSGRVHKLDDLTGRQDRLMASNVFESSRNTGEAAKSRTNFSNTSSKRKAGDNNQNTQNVAIKTSGVIEGKDSTIPTPPPPPSAPEYNAANASGDKNVANAAKDGGQEKSMAELIAEKKKEFDKKREENKNKNNNNQNAQAKPKSMADQIAEKKKEFDKKREENKNKNNNNQNAQNVNIEVPSVIEGKDSTIPTPPPPPSAPEYNAAKASGDKHAADAAKDGGQEKSMADEIAEKKKEFDKKREENKNKNNNNQNAQAKPKSMADEIAEKKKEFDKKREENKNKNNDNQNAQAKPKLTLKQIAENFNDIEGVNIGDAGRLNWSADDILSGNKDFNGASLDSKESLDLSNEGSQPIVDEHSSLKFDSSSDSSQQNYSSEDSISSLSIGKGQMDQRRLELFVNKMKDLNEDVVNKLNRSADDILAGNKNFKGVFLGPKELLLAVKGSVVGNKSMFDMHNKAHSEDPFDLNLSAIDKNDENGDFDVDDSIANSELIKSAPVKSLDLSNKGVNIGDAGRLNRSADDIGFNDVDSEESSLDSEGSSDLSNEVSQSILDEHSSLKFDSSSDSSQQNDSSEDSILSLGLGKENVDQRRLELLVNKVKDLNEDVVDKLNLSADDILAGNKDFNGAFLDSKDPFDLNLSAIDKNDESKDFDVDHVSNFTFADLGDKNKNKNNNNQNAQNVNIEVPSVIEGKDSTIPPSPPPPPPPPLVPKINGANANVNVPQKSQAQELAEKKLELDKKRAEKEKNAEDNKLKEVKALVEQVLLSNGQNEIRKAVKELREKIEKNENKNLTMDELIKEAIKDLDLNDAASVAVKIRNNFIHLHDEDDNESDNESDDDWD